MLKRKEEIYKRIPVLLIVFLLFFITLKRIFVASDCDEWATMIDAYRIARGEMFFKDLWGAQMTSSIPLALIMKLILVIFDSNEYILIFA